MGNSKAALEVQGTSIFTPNKSDAPVVRIRPRQSAGVCVDPSLTPGRDGRQDHLQHQEQREELHHARERPAR